MTPEERKVYNKKYHRAWYLRNREKKREYCRKYYIENKVLCKKNRLEYRRANKDIINEKNKIRCRKFIENCRVYAGNKCVLCASERYLNFHHVNPNDRKFKIGSRYYMTDLVWSELDKCVLICRSCHNKVHKGNDETKKEVIDSYYQ